MSDFVLFIGAASHFKLDEESILIMILSSVDDAIRKYM